MSHDYDVLQENCAGKLSDPVKSPAHYIYGGLEVKEILKRKLTAEEYRGYCKGNVIKYTLRAEHKNGLQDYQKAHEFTAWLIEEVTK